MKFPEKPVAGQPINSGWGEQVLNLLRSLIPQPSPDLMPSWTPTGTTWNLKRKTITDASDTTYFPFQIIQSTFTGTGTPPDDQARRIKVLPGDVNNILPSNINQERVVDANQSSYKVWLEVSLSYGTEGAVSIDSVILNSGSDVPDSPSGNRPARAYRLIGIVTTDANSVTSLHNTVNKSLWVATVMTDYDCTTRVQSVQWT